MDIATDTRAPGREYADTATSAGGAPGLDSLDPRRWRALAVLALIQFMLVLDMTVVNVALPRIKHDLHFSQSGLAWVVNGYVLMAGGLLLLGGRLADIYGRRLTFLIGVSVFALASIACGLATDPAVMVPSRFVQGVGEALAAPAALGMIALLFSDRHERAKALGIWGGVAGLGATSGTVISGTLTDLESWRWIFYVNVPIAVVALLLVPRLVSESRMTRDDHRLDFTGALTATAGLVAVVGGLLQAATHPWASPRTLVPLLGGIALLGLAVAVEARAASPLIPLRFFSNRTRVTANIVALLASAGFFTYVFSMTLYEQQVLQYSPLKSGLSYLPLGLALGAGIGVSATLMPRIGIRALLCVGFFGSGVGLLLTSGIHAHSAYATGVLPGMLLLGLSSGVTFPATANAALHQVTGQDSSLASAVQNATQQIGGALGLACLVTLALRRAGEQVRHGVPAVIAATHGYVLAFRIAAALLAIGGVLVLVLLERGSAEPNDPIASASAAG